MKNKKTMLLFCLSRTLHSIRTVLFLPLKLVVCR